MDIYISFIDIILDPSSCHEIKKKNSMGILAATAGISDSKAILRDLGMKAWNGRSHGLNLKPKRERERYVARLFTRNM
jgi:hypothetical protein